MVQIKGLPLPGIPCCPGASQSSQSANAAVALLLLAPSGASASTAVRATYLLHLCTSSRTVRVASSRAPADPSREEDGRVGEARSDV